MRTGSEILRTLSDLSLDVVAVCVLAGLFAARLTGSTLASAWAVILGLAVWCIYTADHWLDARRNGASSRLSRHRIHLRYEGAITVVWICVSFVGSTTALLLLPVPVLLGGLGLGVLAGLHLVLCQKTGFLWYPKELAVAALFTGGIWLAPLLSGKPTVTVWVAFGLFGAAVFANLLLCSLLDYEVDAREAPNCLAQRWGPVTSRRVLMALALLAPFVAASSGVALTSVSDLLSLLILVLLVGLPAWIARDPGETTRPGSLTLRRALADGAFLMCGLPVALELIRGTFV